MAKGGRKDWTEGIESQKCRTHSKTAKEAGKLFPSTSTSVQRLARGAQRHICMGGVFFSTKHHLQLIITSVHHTANVSLTVRIRVGPLMHRSGLPDSASSPPPITGQDRSRMQVKEI